MDEFWSTPADREIVGPAPKTRNRRDTTSERPEKKKAGQKASKNRTEMEALSARLRMGSKYMLPENLCRGEIVGGDNYNIDACGRTRRALMGLLWISTSNLREKGRKIQRISATDAKTLFGLSGRNDLKDVREIITRLASASVRPFDGEGSVEIFEDLRIFEEEGIIKLDILISESFAWMSINPSVYALLDMCEIVDLTKGMDLFLYQRRQLVRNKRFPQDFLSLDDLERASGVKEGTPWCRVAPIMKSAQARVEKVVRAKLLLEREFERKSVVGVRLSCRGGRE